MEGGEVGAIVEAVGRRVVGGNEGIRVGSCVGEELTVTIFDRCCAKRATNEQCTSM